ncbi:MAG TPA: hypothetical protein VFD78_01655 [Chitinophagaceae bacterium]|nr:hypothetical protein [Chitinophagaceae bacterium]
MRQMLILFILSLTFLTCSTQKPKIKYKEFNSIMNRHVDTLLNSYDANANKYSLLTFTEGFENHLIIVVNNNDTIHKGFLLSDKSMGWAKTYRINNKFNTKIIDLDIDYTFVIKSKYSQSYKNIYIKRNSKKNRSYTITFSNTYQDFY